LVDAPSSTHPLATIVPTAATAINRLGQIEQAYDSPSSPPSW
jgi:hypothetical protein